MFLNEKQPAELSLMIHVLFSCVGKLISLVVFLLFTPVFASQNKVFKAALCTCSVCVSVLYCAVLGWTAAVLLIQCYHKLQIICEYCMIVELENGLHLLCLAKDKKNSVLLYHIMPCNEDIEYCALLFKNVTLAQQ